MVTYERDRLYESTTRDHAPRYIMRETATISEWGRCLDDSRANDEAVQPSWVKCEYSRLDREFGFMRDGFFYKPLFELEDEAKEYQAIIDYDDPNRDKLRECQLIAWDNQRNNKAVVLAGFVSSQKRTEFRPLAELATRKPRRG